MEITVAAKCHGATHGGGANTYHGTSGAAFSVGATNAPTAALGARYGGGPVGGLVAVGGGQLGCVGPATADGGGEAGCIGPSAAEPQPARKPAEKALDVADGWCIGALGKTTTPCRGIGIEARGIGIDPRDGGGTTLGTCSRDCGTPAIAEASIAGGWLGALALDGPDFAKFASRGTRPLCPCKCAPMSCTIALCAWII